MRRLKRRIGIPVRQRDVEPCRVVILVEALEQSV
jgi:hypothetical protein